MTGPQTPPAGTGSAQLNVADKSQGAVLGSVSFESTRLDKITNLGYSTFQSAGSLVPTLQFDIQFDLNDTGLAGRLVFAPDPANSTAVWRTWSALDGKWWASRANQPGEAQRLLGDCLIGTPCTWAHVLAKVPDATIPPGGQLLFKAGSGWTGPASYNVDNFTSGIAGSTGQIIETTYDLEP